MKIALYLRVSTDVQDFNRQKSDLTAKILKDGNEVTCIFSDKISGFKKDKDRPDLNRLLQLTKNDVDAIYITELSRLSRNPTYLRVLLDEFNEKGINVYSLVQNLNSLNSEGKPEFTTDMMISMLSQYSAYEVKLKDQRIKSGKKESILIKGNSYTPKPAYGYMKVEKKILIQPIEAEIVKAIFNKFSEGANLIELVQYLNLKNIPTRNSDFMVKDDFKVNSSKIVNKSDIKWNKNSIRNILRNTVYCGYKILKTGEKIVTPVIVSEELFIKVQSEITNRTNTGDRSRINEFALRSLLKCGECGQQYLGSSVHRDLIYICADKKHKGTNSYLGCKNSQIYKSIIEPMVWGAVKGEYRVLKNTQIKEGNIAVMNERIEDCTAQIKLIDSKLNELEAETAQMIKLYKKGLFDDITLDKEQKLINTEFASLNKTKIALQIKIADSKSTIEAINKLNNLENVYTIETALTEQTETINKEAIHMLLQDILIYRINTRFSVFQLNFKAGYILNLIRETRKDRYQIVNSNIYSFNKETKQFNDSSFNYEPEDLFNSYLKTPELMDLFNGYGSVPDMN
ncbi:MAG TPA: recombinase family protein [Paludibacter sp.]